MLGLLHLWSSLAVIHPIPLPCVFSFLVWDLQNEADAYRKVKLRVEDVQGRNCLTNFYVSRLMARVQQCLGGGCGRLGCLRACVSVRVWPACSSAEQGGLGWVCCGFVARVRGQGLWETAGGGWGCLVSA